MEYILNKATYSKVSKFISLVIVILAKILDIRQLIAKSMKGTNTQET
jgi:hypothetical protein